MAIRGSLMKYLCEMKITREINKDEVLENIDASKHVKRR